MSFFFPHAKKVASCRHVICLKQHQHDPGALLVSSSFGSARFFWRSRLDQCAAAMYSSAHQANTKRPPTVDVTQLSAESFLSRISTKTLDDIPDKYKKPINDQIPHTASAYVIVEGKKSSPIDLDKAKELARNQNKDLMLLNVDDNGTHSLLITDYAHEQQKILERIQKQEADTLMVKTINSLKGQPRGVLEKMNLRIDKGGAEMKANLSRKQLLKGKFVMFQMPAHNADDAEVAKQKLQYVKDFVESNFPDIAFVSTDIEVWKKKAFIEFSPSEAILQERQETDHAKKKARKEKARERTRQVQLDGASKVQKKQKVSKKKDPLFVNPFHGQKFKVQDF
eukprot:CAMPEP_0117452290 /NCGR_PEP_ID=MMETSP0759-20121206/9522_1 /TAXON_ID=63605 /ORGANISM="Percolomonas cosmopolitus, Strain WS" /LENGTH=338 /DNA_ID=CAMNT_0005245067 /DNA_START=10 /DNA_END=1026 /DNA_ORIENTATION=-